MRRTLMKTFGENLELFEIAKLKKKYEELGFAFYVDSKRKGVFLDAFAVHPETKEEIIFEIKSKKNFSKGETQNLLQRRSEFLRLFPKARFVLVLAREPQKVEIPISSLNELLLKKISEKHLTEIQSTIDGFIKLEAVTDIIYDNFDFGNFSVINLKGHANLKFWIQLTQMEFRGESLSDGLPFNFDITLVFNPENNGLIYEIGESSKIRFDFSEFI